MAANGDGDRPESGYVFLVGHGLLVLGYVFFTVGFATNHWVSAASARFGLWEGCVGQVCDVMSPGDPPAWMEATRAMQTLALMCYMGGVLAALFVHCVTHTFPSRATCRPFRGKAWLLEICTAIGCAFCLIGVSVCGGEGDKVGTLGYSYALTVFSLILSITGTVMVAVTRNTINTSSPSRVTPQQQTGGTSGPTVSDPHLPQHPSIVTGASYPYGRGQRNAEPPSFDEGGYGHSMDPYPYGHGAAALSPNDPPQNLPYPMHPEEPTSPGSFGTMTTPEPGQFRGGAGLGPPRGQSRGSGRLPPITEASPSAPPPPPIDGDHPPSYLEAIAQQHP